MCLYRCGIKYLYKGSGQQLGCSGTVGYGGKVWCSENRMMLMEQILASFVKCLGKLGVLFLWVTGVALGRSQGLGTGVMNGHHTDFLAQFHCEVVA